MPALSASVASFLNSLKDRLNTGTDLGQNLRGASINYVESREMAIALDLLQKATSQTSVLTATGNGTALTFVDGASTFVAGQQVGNYVTFASNTTTVALRNVRRRIIANSTTTLTFDSALPATTATGDTLTIQGGAVQEIIDALLQGSSLGGSPAGSAYGDHRLAADGLLRLIRQYAGLANRAASTAAIPSNGASTLIVTGAGALAGVAGNVGRVIINVPTSGTSALSATQSSDGLTATVNLAVNAGALVNASNTVTLVAAAIDALSNFVCSSAGADAIVAGGTFPLSGGADGTSWHQVQMRGTLSASGQAADVVRLPIAGSPLVIDQLAGMVINVTGLGDRRIVSNDEEKVYLDKAYGSAPGAVAFTIRLDAVDAIKSGNYVHPGYGHPFNRYFANLLDQAQNSIATYVLPT